jgi:hypothetical protein
MPPSNPGRDISVIYINKGGGYINKGSGGLSPGSWCAGFAADQPQMPSIAVIMVI